MDGLILAIVIGWAFERAHMIISAPNYESLYNGFGAVDLVNRREAKAPMAYRVLFPWLIAAVEHIFPNVQRIAIYQGLKVIFDALAFWSVAQAFGWPAAMLTAILLLLTIKFDYWDWMPEMTGVCLCLTGNIYLAIIGVVLAALSRETALILPLVFFLGGGRGLDLAYVAAATAMLYIGVRVTIGRRPLYCQRWMIRYNLVLFKNFAVPEFWTTGQWFHQDIFIAVIITILGIASAALAGSITGLVPLIFIGAGWTLAKADETRVFSASLPFIATMLIGGIR